MNGECFQDFMPANVCFGCGSANPDGLRIRSIWQGDEAVCEWQPTPHYQGWAGLTCGGILATLIDCHCMGTAMAAAVKAENRPLGSEPEYRYATGTLNIKYLKPTPIDQPLTLRARVKELIGRKCTLHCSVEVESIVHAEAEVIGILVYRSDRPEGTVFG